MAYFVLLTKNMHATSYVNGVYTSLIRVTLALALDIGLGLFGLKVQLAHRLANISDMKRLT